ncbi:Uncharacterised protein [Vibrio cholerae]|uniref:Uncharacterized protein n=1 Tax=Vibrio cholerae TaxID=666 RepID=A0A655ZF23_VIBCL|nr:Uncharacterised protein [Vibrio cholerae]
MHIDVNNIAQHRKEVFLDPFNDLSIDKGMFGGIRQLKFDAAFTAHDGDIEIFIFIEQLFRVIRVAT